MARALVVSETAVEQMLVRLYVRIGLRNRAEAVRYCDSQCLVDFSSGQM
jgi:DNA-binding NarL/FixJ family response regulator